MRANKGKPSPFKGIPRTEEVKFAVSKANKGRPVSEEQKQMISHTLKNSEYRGEKSNNVKLTESQVIEIRQRYSKGNISQSELGRQYNVHQTMIQCIVARKNWRHI